MGAPKKPLFIATVLISAALAGCLAEETSPKPTGANTKKAPGPINIPAPLPEGFIDPFIMNHAHSDVNLHKLSFHTRLLAHHPLGGTALKSSGAHAVDIQAGYLFVAAYGAAVDVDGGLYIFDLKNPEKPAFVGQLRMVGNLGGDRSMEVNDDATFAVLGTEALDCAGHTNPFAPGFYLIDLADKSSPKIAHYLPSGGVHSLTIHRINNVDYVYALGSGINVGGTNGNILKIDRTGATPRLVPVGSITISHDSAIYDDPVLKVPVLYATTGKSLTAYDLTKPEVPRKLGTWALPDEERAGNYVHAIAVDFVQGRRLVVLESENWQDKPSPLWVLDATDFEVIERIGTWTNPGGKPANAGLAGGGNFNGQLTFSTHNPRVEKGIIYLAHYHGGAWILNISTLAQARAPEILGYYLPSNNNGGFTPRSAEGTYPKPNQCGFNLDEIPIVFDLEVQNGIMYLADIHTGMYAVKLDDEHHH